MRVYKLHLKVNQLDGDYYAVSDSAIEAILDTTRIVYESTGYCPDIDSWSIER